VVREARLAFGGMDAVARRCAPAEAALRGRLLDDGALAGAGQALDFTPREDWRGSAPYRMEAARGLLRRLALRHAGLPAEIFA